MELLTGLWLGMPAWVWLAFLGAVLAVLVFDLGVLHKEVHEIGVKESLWMSALYIGLGLVWAVAVWFIYYRYGGDEAIDPQIAKLATPDAKAWEAVKLYLTGYLVEKALAMDNVFVISMIFTYFAVLGLRALFFSLSAMVHRFHYLKYALAFVLIFIGAKIFLGDWVFGGKVPAEISLSVTFGLLAGGVAYSLWKSRDGVESA